MRSSITIAALAVVASTVAAYQYEDDIFARNADAEPILGANHAGKFIGNMGASVVRGFNEKASSGGRGGRGSGRGGGGGGGGGWKIGQEEEGAQSEQQYQRRSLDDNEYMDALYARYADAHAEPILGANHAGKFIGNMGGSIVRGFNEKASGGGRGGRGSGGSGGSGRGGRQEEEGVQNEQQYQRRSLDDDEYMDALYARYANADAEPILMLNHLGKWTGNAFGSIVRGFKEKSGAGNGQQDPSAQMYKREAEDNFYFEY